MDCYKLLKIKVVYLVISYELLVEISFTLWAETRKAEDKMILEMFVKYSNAVFKIKETSKMGHNPPLSSISILFNGRKCCNTITVNKRRKWLRRSVKFIMSFGGNCVLSWQRKRRKEKKKPVFMICKESELSRVRKIDCYLFI